MRCIGADCPEEGEDNAVCSDFRCRNYVSDISPPVHEPPTKIFVCPVHMSEAIDALQRTGMAMFKCRVCQQPWVYMVGGRE
jgi:hypothetical protein